MPLLTGTRLGYYEIYSLIGFGGMGEVYRAKDLRLNRDVAVKVLLNLSSDAIRLRRFEEEARAAGALNHPNILAVYHMGQYEGAPYLVTELLEGETLRHAMRKGLLPLRKVLDYGVQISNGLEAAHQRGIVHRDLKPENLFITREGHIKILDFGLAKLSQPLHSSEYGTSTLTSGTEPGIVMGTVGYMSPEQVRGERTDDRTDIFSFGALLYEMLSNQRAFKRATATETMAATLREEPTNLLELVPTLPVALQRIVLRCLEKQPAERFQSAADLGFALDSVLDISTSGRHAIIIRPHTFPERRFAAICMAILGLAVTAFLCLRLYPRMRPSPLAPKAAIIDLTQKLRQPAATPNVNGPIAGNAAMAWQPKAITNQAKLALDKEDYRTAVDLCTIVISLSSGDQSCVAIRQHAAVKLADQYVDESTRCWEKGDFEEALQWAERALELDPANQTATKLKNLATQMKKQSQPR